jgi:hypothetical protein
MYLYPKMKVETDKEESHGAIFGMTLKETDTRKLI